MQQPNVKALLKRKTNAIAMNVGKHRNIVFKESPDTASPLIPNSNKQSRELQVFSMEPSVTKMVEYIRGPNGKPIPLIEDLSGIYFLIKELIFNLFIVLCLFSIIFNLLTRFTQRKVLMMSSALLYQVIQFFHIINSQV